MATGAVQPAVDDGEDLEFNVRRSGHLECTFAKFGGKTLGILDVELNCLIVHLYYFRLTLWLPSLQLIQAAHLT